MDTVPDKAVKGEALSHQVRYEDPPPQQSSTLFYLRSHHDSLRPARNTLRCDIVDADYADYEPFATMHFHYRSISM
jgi:hypothetical protein